MDFEECFEDLELVELILRNVSRIWGWRMKEAKGRRATVSDGERCGCSAEDADPVFFRNLQKSEEI